MKRPARGRIGTRVGTWPVGEAQGARRAPAWSFPWPGEAFADRIRVWAQTEVGAGRLFPWLPICFGGGIALYFAAPHEPLWWAAAFLFGVAAVIAILCRHRPVGFPLAMGAAAIAAGFALATLKALYLAHPILAAPVYNAALSGFVEVREERDRSDRVVIRVHKIDAQRMSVKPERVRVAVKKGTAPAVGAFVTLKARLNPPLQPLRPGGYDYARDLYFQKIGAIGFALGGITVAAAPEEPTFWLRYAAAVGGVRDAIDQRIRAAIPGDAGAIASALITGKRDAISAPVTEAMYVSSLAHVLSISGYHMAIVAGVVFFVIRALLAGVPGLAERRPIKKWAAFGALVAAFLYLLLSGAEVATQRSFIMTAIVLVAVMADRAALTLRTIAIAALAVLAVAPQALVHPSFQMSFAATLVLIAVYQGGLAWFQNTHDTPLHARLALFGAREIVGLILVSLLAGLATMPYAAFHFHRLAPYGVLANLLAMPIVSVFVMPAGLLALVAMPFGFDGIFWQMMGQGIGWMTAIAQWVTGLPGAVGRMAAFGIGPLLVGTAGLVVICLLRSSLRWSGGVLIAGAILFAVRAPLPDVLVSGDAQTVAFRNTAGQLSVLKSGSDTFSVREWLAADADARAPKDASLAQDVRCDPAGCVGAMRGGGRIAYAFGPEALAEDCDAASVVVTPRNGPAVCAAMLIDRKAANAASALTLRRDGSNFLIEASRPPGHGRPWARATAPASEPTASSPAATPRAPRDATPRADDLEAGD